MRRQTEFLRWFHTKIMYILRNPIARSRSQYRHEVRASRERREYLTAIADGSSGYLQRSMYWSCLNPFVERFNRSRILVLRFEDLVSDSDETWVELLNFLGLPVERRCHHVHRRTETVPGRGKNFATPERVGFEENHQICAQFHQGSDPTVFLDSGRRYGMLMEYSKAEVSKGLQDPVWEDVTKLEKWLGVSQLWSR